MKTIKPKDFHTFINDDYVGIDINEHVYFYYGYETTWCKRHKIINCDDEKCEEEDKKEWCFVANIYGKETYIPK